VSRTKRPGRSELYIGLMSGTSLDGVDAALVNLRGRPHLLGAAYLPYPKALKASLLALHVPSGDELHRASLAGIQLARVYATAVRRLLLRSRVAPHSVQAIGCHGQTVRHQPAARYTVQLGNPSLLAELAGMPVVADFRSRDIAAGGQGAPLVPAFHAAVFGDRSTHRVIVNIGGIANLTDLPRRGAVTGFDTGPGNVLLDAWIAARLGRALDRDGALASRGRPREALLKAFLGDAYFRRAPPKSTGRDRFNLDWLRSFGVKRYNTEDVQATLAELSARSIAGAISKSCPGAAEVYLCGGGARNRDLVRRISRALDGVPVSTTARLGIHPDWVEAMAFAWLAKRRLECATGNLSSVTGAKGPRVLGALYAA
jgi:anhydro-N-acetylmuramic acid kinase